MGDLHEPDLEDSCDVVSENVGHKNVGIVTVGGAETVRDILDHVQVPFKQFKPCIERVHFKLFLLFPCCLSK